MSCRAACQMRNRCAWLLKNTGHLNEFNRFTRMNSFREKKTQMAKRWVIVSRLEFQLTQQESTNYNSFQALLVKMKCFGVEGKKFVTISFYFYLMQRIIVYHKLWSKKPSKQSELEWECKCVEILLCRYSIAFLPVTTFEIQKILTGVIVAATQQRYSVHCGIWMAMRWNAGWMWREPTFLSQLYYANMYDYITHFYDWCWLCLWQQFSISDYTHYTSVAILLHVYILWK